MIVAVTTGYQFFCELAESIVSGEKIHSAIKPFFFVVDNPNPLSDVVLGLLSIVKKVFEEAVRYSPDGPQEAHFYLVSIEVILNQYDCAIERIQALVCTPLTKVICSKRELFFLCARLYEHQENLVEAKKYYRQAGRSERYVDDDVRAQLIIGCTKNYLGKIIAADLARAQSVKSYSFEHWFAEGEIKKDANAYQDAADAYSKAISMNPDHLMARRCRITVNVGLKKYDRVILDCNFLISIDENSYIQTYLSTERPPLNNFVYHQCQALYERGIAYWKCGEFNKALDDFRMITNYRDVSKDGFIKRVVDKIHAEIGHVLKPIPVSLPSTELCDLGVTKANNVKNGSGLLFTSSIFSKPKGFTNRAQDIGIGKNPSPNGSTQMAASKTSSIVQFNMFTEQARVTHTDLPPDRVVAATFKTVAEIT